MHNPYITGPVEADLRKEINSMFFGGAHEIAKAHKALFRRMRRDENNHLIECECRDPLTKEPDIDITCPYCLGEGYKWDEEWVYLRTVDIGSSTAALVFNTRPMSPGEINISLRVFYLEYSVRPTYYDRIVELKSDIEGSPTKPYQRFKIYKPQTVQALRSDNGRVEFYAVWCSQKDVIFVEEVYGK